LVAFLPVNIRPKDDVGGGNAVGTILTTMGTDIEDPVDRLKAITASTRAAKGQLQGMSQTEVLAYTAGLMAPTALQLVSAMTGVRGPLPFTFNLCVSNVPGPRKTLYLNGSRLEATYPVSIPMHGMALNITLESYADTLNFGFIGCRDALPHLQRLAVYTGDALDELDKLA
jgi:WS/DGAT/MGAT family acyltransferase